jgi:hypothetical protein
MGRLGRALLPGLEVRQKHPLQTIAKRPTDAQHCRKVVSPRTYHKLALVGGTGNLVGSQVAASHYSTISSIWIVGMVLVKFGTSAISVAPCFAPAMSKAS